MVGTLDCSAEIELLQQAGIRSAACDKGLADKTMSENPAPKNSVIPSTQDHPNHPNHPNSATNTPAPLPLFSGTPATTQPANPSGSQGFPVLPMNLTAIPAVGGLLNMPRFNQPSLFQQTPVAVGSLPYAPEASNPKSTMTGQDQEPAYNLPSGQHFNQNEQAATSGRPAAHHQGMPFGHQRYQGIFSPDLLAHMNKPQNSTPNPGPLRFPMPHQGPCFMPTFSQHPHGYAGTPGFFFGGVLPQQMAMWAPFPPTSVFAQPTVTAPPHANRPKPVTQTPPATSDVNDGQRQTRRAKRAVASSSAVTAPMDDEDQKKKRKKRDPSLPTPARFAWNFYFRDQYTKIRNSEPSEHNNVQKAFTDIGFDLGKKWRSLSREEKEPYIRMAAADKERYEREMQARFANPPGSAGAATCSTSGDDSVSEEGAGLDDVDVDESFSQSDCLVNEIDILLATPEKDSKLQDICNKLHEGRILVVDSLQAVRKLVLDDKKHVGVIVLHGQQVFLEADSMILKRILAAKNQVTKAQAIKNQSIVIGITEASSDLCAAAKLGVDHCLAKDSTNFEREFVDLVKAHFRKSGAGCVPDS